MTIQIWRKDRQVGPVVCENTSEILEMQIKNCLRFYVTPVRMIKAEGTKDKMLQQGEEGHMHTATGNINW